MDHAQLHIESYDRIVCCPDHELSQGVVLTDLGGSTWIEEGIPDHGKNNRTIVKDF